MCIGSAIYQSRQQNKAAKKAREAAMKAAGMQAAGARRAELRAQAAAPLEAQEPTDLDTAADISQQRRARGISSTYLADRDTLA